MLGVVTLVNAYMILISVCQVPSDIEHGYTDPGMPVPPGFKIFISCEDSYYLLGRGTITCLKDGYYSPGGECIKMSDKLCKCTDLLRILSN